ncbi:hypothetical protein [Cohnella hongkongensis]|uniref:Uncharacterized protein n=1 Tax=Cohnella hongkongensis TaxID=178337 RepID=A0ABV9FCY2_9BACL
MDAVIRFRRIATSLLALSVMLGAFQATIQAQDTSTKSAVKVLEPVTLGSVKLKENVTAKVNNLIILPSNNNQILSLTLSVQNNSNSEVNFLDYWLTVSTKSGTKLNMQLLNTKISKIPAKSTVNIDFIGTIGSSIKLTDLVVRVIKWDFSAPSYTKVLGQITVPAKYNPTTPSTNGRKVISDDIKASFVVKQSTIGISESYYRPDIRLTIKNEGNRTFSMPDYQFYILTQNNLMYPLTVQDLKGTSLDPLAEKEFQLTASIPIAVEQQNWKLAVVNSMNEGKDKQPVAIFNLVKSQVDTADVKGKYYTFSNSKGTYNIKLNSINRLPIEDEDLVIANLTIANKGKSTLPMPSLNGKFVFNESIEKTASSNNSNKVISIKPGESANIQLISRVPYTFEVSDLNLVVQQKETSGTNEQITDLVKFSTKGKFDPIQKVASDTGYLIEDIGYRAEVKVKSRSIYTGDSADILVAQLMVQNQEKRQTAVHKLAGYFEKADGTIFPATFDNVIEKLDPSGKAIVYVTATVPKNTDTSDISLVVGKAVTEAASGGSQAAEPSDKLVGYTDPHSLSLPPEKEPQIGLQKLDFSPYEFSITRVGTQTRFDINEVSMDFDYTLSADLLTKANTKDHKIIIEIRDDTRDYAFSRELSLPTAAPATGEENTTLRIGEHKLTPPPWKNDQFVFLIDVLKDFHLNVYYQVKPGYKTLVATQKLPWYIDKKLN